MAALQVAGRVESWISNQTWVDKLLWNTQDGDHFSPARSDE